MELDFSRDREWAGAVVDSDIYVSVSLSEDKEKKEVATERVSDVDVVSGVGLKAVWRQRLGRPLLARSVWKI